MGQLIGNNFLLMFKMSVCIFVLYSSRSQSKGKLVSNGHNSPAKKGKSLSQSPKKDVVVLNEKKSNSKAS